MYIESSQQTYPTTRYMTTTSPVTFYPIDAFQVTYAQPQRKLKDVINSQINQTTVMQVLSSERKMNVTHVLEGNNLVGNNNEWTVLYRSNANEELLQRMSALEHRVDDLTDEVNTQKSIILDHLIEPMIRNVASQILLYSLGEQPKTDTRPSNRFIKNSNAYKFIEQMIESEDLNMSASHVTRNLDLLIDRRNACIHEPYDKLLNSIEKCKWYFIKYPQLVNSYQYEHFVIQRDQQFTPNSIKNI
jgi:hypothetical protein